MVWFALNDSGNNRDSDTESLQLSKEDLLHKFTIQYNNALNAMVEDDTVTAKEILSELSKEDLILDELDIVRYAFERDNGEHEYDNAKSESSSSDGDAENQDEEHSDSPMRHLAFAVYYNLAQLEEKSKNISEADALYFDAILLNRYSFDAWLKYGYFLLLLKGDFYKSVLCFETVLSSFKENNVKATTWDALCGLIMSYFMLLRLDKCKQLLEIAFGIKKDYKFGLRLQELLELEPKEMCKHELFQWRDSVLRQFNTKADDADQDEEDQKCFNISLESLTVYNVFRGMCDALSDENEENFHLNVYFDVFMEDELSFLQEEGDMQRSPKEHFASNDSDGTESNEDEGPSNIRLRSLDPVSSMSAKKSELLRSHALSTDEDDAIVSLVVKNNRMFEILSSTGFNSKMDAYLTLIRRCIYLSAFQCSKDTSKRSKRLLKRKDSEPADDETGHARWMRHLKSLVESQDDKSFAKRLFKYLYTNNGSLDIFTMFLGILDLNPPDNVGPFLVHILMLIKNTGFFGNSSPFEQIVLRLLPHGSVDEKVMLLFDIVEKVWISLKNFDAKSCAVTEDLIKFCNEALAHGYFLLLTEKTADTHYLLVKYWFNMGNLKRQTHNCQEKEISACFNNALSYLIQVDRPVFYAGCELTQETIQKESYRTIAEDYMQKLKLKLKQTGFDGASKEDEDLVNMFYCFFVQEAGVTEFYNYRELPRPIFEQALSGLHHTDVLNVMMHCYKFFKEVDNVAKAATTLLFCISMIYDNLFVLANQEEFCRYIVEDFDNTVADSDQDVYLVALDTVQCLCFSIFCLVELNNFLRKDLNLFDEGSLQKYKQQIKFAEVISKDILYCSADVYDILYEEVETQDHETFAYSFEAPLSKEFSSTSAKICYFLQNLIDYSCTPFFVRNELYEKSLEYLKSCHDYLASLRECCVGNGKFLQYIIEYSRKNASTVDSDEISISDGMILQAYNCMYNLKLFNPENHSAHNLASLSDLDFETLLSVYSTTHPILSKHYLERKDAQEIIKSFRKSFLAFVPDQLLKNSNIRYNSEFLEDKLFREHTDVFHLENEILSDLMDVTVNEEEGKILFLFLMAAKISLRNYLNSLNDEYFKTSSRISSLEDAVQDFKLVISSGILQGKELCEALFEMSICIVSIVKEELSWRPSIIMDRFDKIMRLEIAGIRLLILSSRTMRKFKESEMLISCYSELGQFLYLCMSRPSSGRIFSLAEQSRAYLEDLQTKLVLEDGYFITKEKPESPTNQFVFPETCDNHETKSSAACQYVFRMAFRCFKSAKDLAEKLNVSDWELEFMMAKCQEKLGGSAAASTFYLSAIQSFVSMSTSPTDYFTYPVTVLSLKSSWRLPALEDEGKIVLVDPFYKAFSFFSKRAVNASADNASLDTLLVSLLRYYKSVTGKAVYEPKITVWEDFNSVNSTHLLIKKFLMISDMCLAVTPQNHRIAYRMMWILGKIGWIVEEFVPLSPFTALRQSASFMSWCQQFVKNYLQKFMFSDDGKFTPIIETTLWQKPGKHLVYFHSIFYILIETLIHFKDYDTMFTVLRKFGNQFLDYSAWPKDIWLRGFDWYCKHYLFPEFLAAFGLERAFKGNHEDFAILDTGFNNCFWFIKDKFPRKMILRAMPVIEKSVMDAPEAFINPLWRLDLNPRLTAVTEVLKKIYDARSKLRDSVPFVKYPNDSKMKWEEINVLDKLLCICYSYLFVCKGVLNFLHSKLTSSPSEELVSLEMDRTFTLLVQILIDNMKKSSPAEIQIVLQIQPDVLMDKMKPFMKNGVRVSQSESLDLVDHTFLTVKANSFVRGRLLSKVQSMQPSMEISGSIENH